MTKPNFLFSLLALACMHDAFAQSALVTYLGPPPAQPTTVDAFLPHTYDSANCSLQVLPVSGTPANIVTQLASSCATFLKLDGFYYPLADTASAYAGLFAVTFPSTPARTCSAGIAEAPLPLLADKNRQPTGAPLLSLSQYLLNMSTDLITFDVFPTSPRTIVINIRTQSGNIRCTNPVNNPADSIFKNGFQNP